MSYVSIELEAPHGLAPWVASPHSLVSWWDMEQFSAKRFFVIANAIHALESIGKDTAFDQEAQKIATDWLKSVIKDCGAIGLRISSLHAGRIHYDVEHGNIKSTPALQAFLPELRNRIEDELGEKMFMYIPTERAERYDQKELFGREVNAKFPSLQYDCVEAGNCYACGRGTAAVFHLGRIMEAGVQALGSKLGVALVNEKVWQVILNDMGAAIKKLPSKDAETVELCQIHTNLYAVKVAWRNEVMHPKDTYTLEEADNLIRQVKIFMEQLAKVV